MDDALSLSAAEQAAAIAAGRLSALDLVEASLARIGEVQPSFNPFTVVFAEEAIAAARAADGAVGSGAPLGALHGVPVAFKDFTPTEGQLTTRGSAAFEGVLGAHDPAIVRRFKAAGAIVVAKTTTPEFAHSSFTRSPLWGHTLNPWDPARTCGGSSGGSAVAVATGAVALAEGTDMGGSVRIPAACCGIVGLKPSLGRIPMDILPTVFDDMSHFGPLARSVGDAALFLSVAEGPDEADIGSQIAPVPLPARLDGDLRGLRIALSPDLGFYAVDAEVAANLALTADALRDAGAEVREVALGWDARLVDAWFQWWGVYLAAAFAGTLATHRDRMDPDVVQLIESGLAMDAVSFARIDQIRTEAWRRLAAVFATHDALICPTIAVPAPAFEATDSAFLGTGPDGRFHGFDMTAVFNAVGQCPALSVPSGMTAAGLPTAAQIVTRRFQDGIALQIGRAVERRRPWPLWPA